ncbi:putative syntaxin-8B, partial [Neolecta irregularis DAH-3]
SDPVISHLTLLADSVLYSSIQEYNRLKSLSLEPSQQDKDEIQKGLETLRNGVRTLEEEQSRFEQSGDRYPSKQLKEREDLLIRLHNQYDNLVGMLDGEIHQGSLQLPPTRAVAEESFFQPVAKKQVRFREEAEEMEDHEVLQFQQQIMNDQDISLDHLSESIGRQRDLSLQIGNELEHHGEILEEMDGLVDRSQSRLDIAKRRLRRISQKARDNGRALLLEINNAPGQITTIVILIVILLVLIMVFK